ncbi:MAG: hypothetical protein JXA77_05110 [Bacteroidales bacterium]|nr:hypothetical protein [Bacteroidales bacterium]MBN2820427.1 hypothetical protein [Bacteroidales bacterium]
MKKVFTKVIFASVFATLSLVQLNAQTGDGVIGKISEDEHPTVINEKALQRMLHSYENANVVEWVDIFTQNNFQDVKLFYAAYNSIDFNAIGERNIVDVVNERIEEIKSGSDVVGNELLTNLTSESEKEL